ncbi:hypothetical protein ACWGST_03690 [Agromyces sp. NPDC055520]
MKSKLAWPALALAAILVGAIIPVLFHPTFFFADDTQAGAFGQWYKIGDRILQGDWSLLNPTVWQSSNYLAEGAWGIFSPVLWIVGLASHVFPSALVFSTVVKISCLLLGGFGLYLLARDFGVDRAWSATIAAAAPLAGFTMYMDAASWVNGLMAWAFFPLAWVLTRRAAFGARSIVPAAAASIALVGIGYAHGTLFLGLMFVATIIEALVARQRFSAIRAFVVAAVAGLFAIVVHLPALLSSGVSGRASGVFNTGLLTVDLTHLASSSSAVGMPTMRYFFEGGPAAPIFYMAWFIPVLAFVDWKRLTAKLREDVSLVLMFGLSLIAVLLPSDIGPLRFPVRLMPYLTMTVLLIVAIGMSRCRAEFVTRRRFVAAAGWYTASVWLAFTQSPRYWHVQLATLLVGVIALWIGYRIFSTRGLPRYGGEHGGALAGRGTTVAAIGIVVVLVGLLIPQHFAHRQAPLRDYGIPTTVAEMQVPLQGAGPGDVIVAGGPEVDEESTFPWDESLVSNLWYVNGRPVQNAYTSVYYPSYSEATCMAYNGIACPELYEKLFERQDETGEMLVDLLGVSSVQVIKIGVEPSLWEEVPDGWHVTEDTAETRLIVRDEPVPGAGGVVWEDAGTKVTVDHQDAMGVTFTVDEVGADGGRVALSRIGWPGYRVDGGSVASEPVEGFLMAVDLPADSVGKQVTVSYWAPGWGLQALSGGLIVLILIGWGALRLRGRRRAGQTPRNGLDRVAAGAVQKEPRVSLG